MTRLTERQGRFVRAYSECGNGAEAARRAGYAAASAEVTASRLLRKAKVVSALQDLQGEEDSLRDPERVLRHLWSKVEDSEVRDRDQIAALGLLSKCLGMQLSKVEVADLPGSDRPLLEVAREVIANLEALGGPEDATG